MGQRKFWAICRLIVELHRTARCAFRKSPCRGSTQANAVVKRSEGTEHAVARDAESVTAVSLTGG